MGSIQLIGDSASEVAVCTAGRGWRNPWRSYIIVLCVCSTWAQLTGIGSGRRRRCMLTFPSPEWVAAWVELANSDQAFRSAGAGWDGVVGGVIEADEAAGVGDDLYLRLVGRDGCWYENILGADAGLVDGSVFTIRGPYSAWKSVIRQQLHPLVGVVQGRLRFRGQLSSFLRWSRAMVIMTELAGRLDTAFVDEQR